MPSSHNKHQHHATINPASIATLFVKESKTLHALLHSASNSAKVAVNLAGRATKNERHDCLASDVNVLEASKNVHLLVGEHDSRPAGVLDRKLCLSILSCYAADCSAHVLAVEGLDVLDLEGLDVEVVETEERDSVVDVKSECESGNEVGALLQRAGVDSLGRSAQLDGLLGHVHAQLQAEVLDERRVDFGPGGLERCHAVWWDADLALFFAGSGGRGDFGCEDGTVLAVDLHAV